MPQKSEKFRRLKQLLYGDYHKMLIVQFYHTVIGPKDAGRMATSVDSDQTAPSEAVDVGLHCLSRPVCPNCKDHYGTLHVSEADPNIRDYSGKKPKQYLKNSASSRAQRKFLTSSFTESCEASMTVSMRNSVNVSQSSDLRSSVTMRSGLTISQPMDFRQSVNLPLPVSPGPGQGFGSAAQRSSVRIVHLSLSDQAPEGNASIVETKLGDI